MTQPAQHLPDEDDEAAGDGGVVATGDRLFDAYAEAMEASEAPLLGHLVLYSIFDGRVTPDRLEKWFKDLDLDLQALPGGLRADAAFEKVTGPAGVRRVYPLDDPTADPRPKSRRKADAISRQATLMVRHVRRDRREIVRHIVREVRDEDATSLSYDSKLGEAIFRFDTSAQSDPGAGALGVAPDNGAIAKLPEAEQGVVRDMLGEITTAFQYRRTFYSGDRLRALVRDYVEDLGGIKVRPTGGVYFVHRQHAATLAALRTLVARFGEGSHFVRIPIPDQDEMREMIITAFTTQTRDELNQLAIEVAAARREGASDQAVQKLYRRFRDVQKLTVEHSELLSTSLDDTKTALDLVKLQLGALLATSDDEDDDE
ncbi:DUF6744 family protein [Kutzneria buriramensis]|uniref:Uncharacterized protein n=1 Tax=Kutzneria buriramensis TaxID=1045776 RepID=A0A3E0G7I7_9PSEU|nr:DUF6744 family protein [Kutzneria buriramensis]REH18305.1 hypothetical protein BCF44_13660 [Kutzneria buriramensis]